MARTYDFFATTAKGMEPVLARELTELGIRGVKEGRSGVSFQGPIESAYRACLWSRIANRVLLPLKTFLAPHADRLYAGVKQIDWSEHLDPGRTFAVDFTSTQSLITHTHFGALKVKDAIVDQFREKTGQRPSIDTQRPDLRINVYLSKNECTVSLDLSADSLHLRGYREEGASAPLKENLAATILMLADWKTHAAAGAAFIDPMTGSGTLPIEATLMALNTPPGYKREYWGFLGWKRHIPKVWEKVLEESRAPAAEAPPKLGPIVGFDQDPRAVHVALNNIERAGLRGKLHIEKRELALCEPMTGNPNAKPLGVVIVNPPYGERLGEPDEKLNALYKRIGDTFKQKFKGWEGYVFTGNPEAAKHIGLKASRRHVLFNGPIECRLFKYELY